MSAPARNTGRDPANELYDRACALLADACDLHRGAAQPGNHLAVAATLGCLESALGELAASYRLLQRTTSRLLVQEDAALAERFDEAVARLEDARAATDGVRAFVGPLLARACPVPPMGSSVHGARARSGLTSEG